MTFTVEVADAAKLAAALRPGVPRPRRALGAAPLSAAVDQRTGIGVARSTGTAVTLFCGEPSMTRSE